MKKPRAYSHYGFKIQVIPYSGPRGAVGGIAEIFGTNIYPDEAARLSKWLADYVRWHEYEDSKKLRAKSAKGDGDEQST